MARHAVSHPLLRERSCTILRDAWPPVSIMVTDCLIENNGILNPSVLDVREYYNFDPAAGANISQAASSDLMSSEVSGLTAAQFKANGIDPATTRVGQWRASVTAKISASAASSAVFLGKA